MADIASLSIAEPSSPSTITTATTYLSSRGAKLKIPPSGLAPRNPTATTQATARLRNSFALASPSPVNQNGSFEFDRVLKSGYVQRRTQKTKTWKSVYLVLRPISLSIYKSDKESKLRHKIYLSELSAVTLLRDPKQKRQNLFGLFSPARNFHFEAPTAQDAQEWIELVRQHARIEEEEEELYLASPVARRHSYAAPEILGNNNLIASHFRSMDIERRSSSPEPLEPPAQLSKSLTTRRSSHNMEPALSGNELLSHSDFSDNDAYRVSASIENLAAQSPSGSAVLVGSQDPKKQPMAHRNPSQISGINVENDPDRVIWQGRLQFLKSKRGVKQWKKCWAVLRPRNLILYKDESEYTAVFIVALSAIVNVVDIDPISKTKLHCMQIITDEKSYRFCAQDEETLVQCLGAFKSLLSKRKDLEARKIAAASAPAVVVAR